MPSRQDTVHIMIDYCRSPPNTPFQLDCSHRPHLPAMPRCYTPHVHTACLPHPLPPDVATAPFCIHCRFTLHCHHYCLQLQHAVLHCRFHASTRLPRFGMPRFITTVLRWVHDLLPGRRADATTTAVITYVLSTCILTCKWDPSTCCG